MDFSIISFHLTISLMKTRSQNKTSQPFPRRRARKLYRIHGSTLDDGSTKFRGCYCARHLANERIKCNQFVKKLLARLQREGGRWRERDVFKFLKETREREREGRVRCRIQVHTITALHPRRSKFLLNSKHKFRNKLEGRGGEGVSRPKWRCREQTSFPGINSGWNEIRFICIRNLSRSRCFEHADR